MVTGTSRKVEFTKMRKLKIITKAEEIKCFTFIW